MRGRKPKPTSLHELHGTLNATRHAKRVLEPRAEGSLGEPPEWMSPSQKEGWTHAVANAPAGILKSIDRGVMAVWVVAEDQHRVAATQQAALDAGSKLPLLTKSKSGIDVSPYLDIMHKAAMLILKAASELGFSPACRPRLVGAGDAPRTEGAPVNNWERVKVLQGGKSSGAA